GTFSYDWDLSNLVDQVYFIRVVVTDESGQSSTTDSRFGVSVYHGEPVDGDVPAPGDLAVIKLAPGGCQNAGCTVESEASPLAPLGVGMILSAALVFIVFRRS